MMQDALSAITYIPPFCLRLLHTAHPSWLSDCRWLVWLYAAHGSGPGPQFRLWPAVGLPYL